MGLFHFPLTAASLHNLLLPSLPAQHVLDEHGCTVSGIFSEVAGALGKGSADCLSTASQLLEAEIHGTSCHHHQGLGLTALLQQDQAGTAAWAPLLHIPDHSAGGCMQTTAGNVLTN